MGKIVILDISETGNQIGEKLFTVLDAIQKKELMQYVLGKKQSDIDNPTVIAPNHDPREHQELPLSKIYEGDLYFCLEHRMVCVRDQEIDLTVKEFDILALLIMNPKRVFTYEMIVDIVWREDYDYYSRKAINNHVNNLRKKLNVEPNVPDYIKGFHSVGYKFEHDPVLWTIDPLDWCRSNVGCITDRVMKKAGENEIILMHDYYDTSVTAALKVVDELLEKGYVFVTVEEIMFD